jgi:hypothetical protein
MAWIFGDSMDLYDSLADMVEAGWQYSSSSISVAVGLGRFGGNAVRVARSDVPWWIRRVFAITGNEIGIQAAFSHQLLSEITSAQRFLEVRNNSAVDLCFSLYMLPTGALQLRSSANTIIATSSGGIIKEDQWQYLEIWALINNAGTVRVLIDGVQIFNESVDTSLANTDVDAITYYGSGGGSGTNGILWDDFVIMDGSGAQFNALLGDSRYDDLVPNEDVIETAWTCSSGFDRFAMIDDSIPGDHDGDATYIEASGAGEEVRCGFAALLAGSSTVHGVIVATAMKKTDSGAITARALINSNGTEQVGATQSPTTTYQTLRDYFELDPDGGGTAWSPAAVNALEAGVEVVA